jgi:hypothetical protein
LTLRDTRPDLFKQDKQDPPKARVRRLPLYAGLLALLGVGVFFGVQAVTSSSSSSSKVTVVTIPPPPKIIVGAQASQSASASPSASASTGPTPHALTSPGPIAGSQYAGKVVLNATGSQLARWNQTSSYCAQEDWQVGDGSVYTDSSDDAVLTTTGKLGSCVALVSPQRYSSAVIEAYAYFPPLPGSSGTIADWTSLWMVNQSQWPQDGELDAVEAEPATGVNAAAYHWGSPGSEQSVSTDGYASDGALPKDGPNLTPGWHVIDIAYTAGFFSVWYDGKQFTTAQNSVITGSALNLLITSSVTPATGETEQTIGGSPKNSDSQPAGMAVKYVKIWSFKQP